MRFDKDKNKYPRRQTIKLNSANILRLIQVRKDYYGLKI